jgi:hypothetical protein
VRLFTGFGTIDVPQIKFYELRLNLLHASRGWEIFSLETKRGV